ncbi:MAG TPA: universal stress protein [Flavobacteriales bacterium]|nr:universal stress protein [Flavobacteriales bacterium]HPH83363.1 universal stress protein [Flavobacteriales bacterium]
MKLNTIKPIDSEVILVPYDFTEAAQNAVAHANLLARLFHKKIVLLHVVEKGLFKAGTPNTLSEKETDKKLKGIAATNTADQKIETSHQLRSGNIFDTIADAAGDLNAALVVMGTHGVTGMQHVTGSKALKVITNSNRPFVVVQKKDVRLHGYKNIVLPFDFSKETKQKLVWAVELSKVFNSTFHILAAYESDEYTAKAVSNNIAYAKNYLKSRDCDFKVTTAEKGDFSKETIRFASYVEADLIIIMTNQGKSLTDFIIGPYEQNVIANDAQIPVMTLNPVDNMNSVNGHLFNFGNF